MLDWSSCSAVERDPQRVSGEWVFRGTRVPVVALFENLEDGMAITEFVTLFPGVTLEQVRLVLDPAASFGNMQDTFHEESRTAGPLQPTHRS